MESRRWPFLCRPPWVGGARPLRVDRDRDSLLPLVDHKRRVDAAALAVELDVVAGEVPGPALGCVHGPNGLRDLLAGRKTRLFDRLLQDPHVPIGAQAILGEPRLAGALLELVDKLALAVVAPIGYGDECSFERVGACDLEQLWSAKMRAIADDRQLVCADAHL